MVYDKVTLPGDSHVALLLRMTEYFVRNITSVCLLKSNSTIYILSLRYPVQRTFCHNERKIGDSAGYFCTRGEKEYASIRQAIVACGD